MINAMAIVVMKAGWGQGHGRERSCELNSLLLLCQALREMMQDTVRLANCPQARTLTLCPALTTMTVKVAS